MISLEEKFNNACNIIFNNSMKITNELNVFLTQFGAKNIIERHKNEFVSTTLFTCLYFFEIVLVQSKQYDNELIRDINSAMVEEMSNRIKQPFEVVEKKYLNMKKNLGDLAENKKLQEQNPFVLASILYLQVALCDEFNTDKLNDEEYERLIVGLANTFMSIIKNKFDL